MNPTRPAIRELLASVGPMTFAEISRFFPLADSRRVGAQISAMRRARFIHVQSWETVRILNRSHPTAVYALGDKRDAPKPKPKTNSELARAFRAKRKVAPLGPNSVWQLGALS